MTAAEAVSSTDAGLGPEARGSLPRMDTPVVCTHAAELSAALEVARARGASVGLVPTMGALHAGHAALIARARAECYVVAVTVFVNPTQFNDPADLAAYPRSLDADASAAAAAGADYVFAPEVTEIYPPGDATVVSVPALASVLEGASRPGHFDGVATVVAKLFAIAGPCNAYFGEKDYQQLLVVRQMVRDLRIPVTVIGCPTVRDEDGLALSSRNARLSPDERYAAAVLHQALLEGRRAIEEGADDPATVETVMTGVVATEPLAALDYVAAVSASDLSRPERLEDEVRLLVAARFGDVRLIDNLGATAGIALQEGLAAS